MDRLSVKGSSIMLSILKRCVMVGFVDEQSRFPYTVDIY